MSGCCICFLNRYTLFLYVHDTKAQKRVTDDIFNTSSLSSVDRERSILEYFSALLTIHLNLNEGINIIGRSLSLRQIEQEEKHERE
jgi:hypothetical protein